MKNIFDYSLEELKAWFQEQGESAFRGKQVYDYLYQGVYDIDAMKTLSDAARSKLKASFEIYMPKVLHRLESKDGTVKLLLLLKDGNIIETVIMKYVYGYSVCVSSQIGCRMGCTFCASTKDGMVRNLSAGEILSQVVLAGEIMGERIGRVVLMGSGEPLDNLEEVLRFLSLVHQKEGLYLSLRNITLSTCGMVDKIYELADQDLPITLAISLHETTDIRRQRIMPIAKRWTIDEILKSVDYYMERTGRRVSFEYALVEGENDGVEDAIALAKLLDERKVHVNLIPINVIKEMLFRPTKPEVIQRFQLELKRRGIEATIRREMGSDIDAACGQLRRSYIEKSIEE